MWSDATKCKYMFIFPLKNLARKAFLRARQPFPRGSMAMVVYYKSIFHVLFLQIKLHDTIKQQTVAETIHRIVIFTRIKNTIRALICSKDLRIERD